MLIFYNQFVNSLVFVRFLHETFFFTYIFVLKTKQFIRFRSIIISRAIRVVSIMQRIIHTFSFVFSFVNIFFSFRKFDYEHDKFYVILYLIIQLKLMNSHHISSNIFSIKFCIKKRNLFENFRIRLYFIILKITNCLIQLLKYRRFLQNCSRMLQFDSSIF